MRFSFFLSLCCMPAMSTMAFMARPVARRVISTQARRAFVSTASQGGIVMRGQAPRMEQLSRAEHMKVATMGFLGGVAMFASGGSAKADDTGFETSSSGLKYKILKEGTGAIPAPGQSVNVHYTGWLDGFDDAGRKFDSSYDRRRPLTFKAGVGQVIQGWDEAVLQMKVGEKRNVIIPSSLGYGSRGAGGVIPPNATLFFTMELLGIA